MVAMQKRLVAISATWHELGLQLNDKQIPFANESNAALLLGGHADWKSRIWFDEFHGRVFMDDAGRNREWSDADDVNAAIWVQTACGMPRMSVDTMRKAVNVVAQRNKANECRQWVESLTHDGTPRLDHFLPEIMGSPDDDYSRRASRNFWVSLVARTMDPGCQVDNMLVLEGRQGIGKSSALRIIGGDWYAEAHESLREKDFFLGLAGKLLVEITEMDAFSRADTSRVKQVVTCRVDRYRAPYEARAQDHKRHTVFCGTTNDDAYLRDATGGRRFWPIRCGEIRLDLLQDQRDQLFAEAIALYRKGETWWEMPAKATLEAQDERRQTDPWEESVLSYLALKTRVAVPEVLGNIGLEVKNFDKQSQMRVADILRANGWQRALVFEHGRRQRLWTKNETEKLI